MVLGRDKVLEKIKNYVTGVAEDKAVILLGGPGVGKSSIMTKTADEANTMALARTFPG